MSRYIGRSNQSSRNNNNVDQEDNFLESQALIDDQELCDPEVDLFSATPYDIRKRQPAHKSNWNGSNDDCHELRNLNSRPNGHNKIRDLINEPVVEFTHYDIQQGDSLQSICLRFACSVNQVKRYNGLMSDQDFHALRRIKLPLGKFGLLEDFLKAKQADESDQTSSHTRTKTTINSPGSALYVSSTRRSQFKPLLSPDVSNDKTEHHINIQNEQSSTATNGAIKLHHNHSHSLSSLDFQVKDDVNIDFEQQPQQNNNEHHLDIKALKQQKFIKAELEKVADNEHPDIDDLLDMDFNTTNSDNVEKVFEDLDYHLERAKAVAETYDKRATELVNQINDGGSSLMENIRIARVTKIPELFFCSENFGLNYKKLLVFIFVVCLIGPLVYISQTTVVTT